MSNVIITIRKQKLTPSTSWAVVRFGPIKYGLYVDIFFLSIEIESFDDKIRYEALVFPDCLLQT